MQVTNGFRTFIILPIYTQGHVTLEDVDNGHRLQLPLHIAFAYPRTTHAQISPLRTKSIIARD